MTLAVPVLPLANHERVAPLRRAPNANVVTLTLTVNYARRTE
jgi:hypothetical protein